MDSRHGNFTQSTLYSQDLRHAWTRISELEVGEKIPGFRTSAVFFTSLRANILLAETPSTPVIAPLRFPASSHDLHKSHTFPAAVPSSTSALASTSTTKAKHRTRWSAGDIKLPPRLVTPWQIKQAFSSLPATPSWITPPSPRKTRPRTPPSQSSTPPTTPSTNTTFQRLHTSKEDDIALRHRALTLLSSTVSEQQHTAFRSIITHPITILIWMILLSLVRTFICLLYPTSCQNISVVERTTPAVQQPVIHPLKHQQLQQHAQHPTRRSYSPPAICGIVPTDYSTIPPQQRVGADSSETVYDVHRAVKWFPLHILFAWAILSLVVVVGARFASYLYRAEGSVVLDPSWLGSGDEVIVAYAPTESASGNSTTGEDAAYGADVNQEREILGVVVLTSTTLTTPSATQHRSNSNTQSRRKKIGIGRTFIKGWAVHPYHRHQGIGRALLAEVVRNKICSSGSGMTKEKLGGNEGVWFSSGHAHSGRPLHGIFDKAFMRRDRWAGECLEGVVDREVGCNSRGRR